MKRRPLRATRTDTLFPYTTRCRSRLGGQFIRTADTAWRFLPGDRRPSGRRILGIVEQNQPESPVFGLLANHWTLRPSPIGAGLPRSEEHKSELQSLMRNSYAVFCLTKKKTIRKEQK